MGDVDEGVHILATTVLRRGRVASPTLGLFTPGKPRYSFYRRLSGFHNQTAHKS